MKKFTLLFLLLTASLFGQDCDLTFEGYKGWYSYEQELLGGAILYTTTDGDTIKVTEITKDTVPFGNFSDWVYKGEICDYVGRVSIGKFMGAYQATTSFAYQNSNILDFMKMYKNWCNEEVEVEVYQWGEVTGKYVPIKDQNGAISAYARVPVDTVWQAVQCPEYKEKRLYGINLIDYYTSDTTYDIIRSGTTPIIDYTQPYKTTISRKQTCKVKRRELDWSRFLEWLAEKL